MIQSFIYRTGNVLLAAFLVLFFFIAGADAQNVTAKVTKIDEKAFAELIKPGEKPLLINFWATWCVPCVEEFPDLVKIDKEYKGKIDFITVSLDFEKSLMPRSQSFWPR